MNTTPTPSGHIPSNAFDYPSHYPRLSLSEILALGLRVPSRADLDRLIDDLADSVVLSAEEHERLMRRKSCEHERWISLPHNHLCLGCGFHIWSEEAMEQLRISQDAFHKFLLKHTPEGVVYA